MLVALAAGWWVGQQPASLGLFVGLLLAVLSLVLSLLFAIWTLGFYTLRYTLGPDSLTIGWLLREDEVPYTAISALYGGQRLAEPPRVRGIVWPGNYVGRSRARNLGVLQVFATTVDCDELTVLLTDVGGYALSPDPSFREALVDRLEAARDLPPSLVALPTVPRQQPLARALADRWLLAGALASLLLLLAMLGGIIERYESLPELLVLRLDTLGQPVDIRSRFELFHLPAVGAVVLLVDVLAGICLHGREVLAARLLWVAPILVALVLAVALARTLY